MLEWLLKYRVRMSLVLGVLGFIFLRPSQISYVLTGLGAAFLGLLIRTWAAGCIKKSQSLATEGPYAAVRHPLYFGSLVMCIGGMIAVTSFDKEAVTLISWALFALYFGVVYAGVMAKEEKFLETKFGNDWLEYRRHVPALLPYRFPSIRKLGASVFSWQQYRKNKEYQVLLGWVAGSFLLFWALPNEKASEFASVLLEILHLHL